MCRRFGIPLGLAVGTLTGLAHAGDPAAAEALFREGRTLMAAGDSDAACAKFKASHALEPSAGALLNLADCDEKRGKSATAWAEFVAAAGLARAQGKDKQQSEATRRASELEPKLRFLTVRVSGNEAGLEVRRDGAVLDPSAYGTRLPVDPGLHTVDASAKGYERWHADVQAGSTPGSDIVEVPRLTPIATGPAAATAAPGAQAGPRSEPKTAGPTPPPAPTPEPATRSRTWPWIVGGVGGALLLGGSVAGGLALGANADAEQRCPVRNRCADPKVPSIVDRRDTLALLANIGVGAGLAGLGTAAVLLLVLPPESAEAGWRVQPLVGQTELGLDFVGRY
jgi:hypothetical protein